MDLRGLSVWDPLAVAHFALIEFQPWFAITLNTGNAISVTAEANSLEPHDLYWGAVPKTGAQRLTTTVA